VRPHGQQVEDVNPEISRSLGQPVRTRKIFFRDYVRTSLIDGS